MSFMPLALAGFAGRRGRKKAATFVDILVDPLSSRPMSLKRFRSLAVWARNAVARRYFKHVDAVFAVSNRVKDDLARLGIAGKVLVVHDAKDVGELRRRAQVPLALPSGQPRIGTAAVRVDRAKGIDGLLRAFATVRTNLPEAACLIAGEPADSLDVPGLAKELGIREGVHMLGFVEDTAPLFAALDIFVMPSLSEGLNSSILEAAALGIPVVATNVGGIPEAVIDGETGLLVPPDDSEALAAAILRLTADQDLAHRLAANAQRRVETQFAPAAIYATVDAEYNRALAQRFGKASPATPSSNEAVTRR